MLVERVWRGVSDAYPVEAAFLASAEARKLTRLAAEQAEVYSGVARLVRASTVEAEPEADSDGDEAEAAAPRAVSGDGGITRPSQLLDAVLAAGRKGLSIARYKGLGEMNAEQRSEERRVGKECRL